MNMNPYVGSRTDRRESEITMSDLARLPVTRASSTPSQQPIEQPPPMELHLDRLRRDRHRATESERQRRMSRFSTMSSTPTIVEPASHAPPPFTSTPTPPAPARPSIKEVVRKHPRNIVYLSVLLALFAGGAAGWAVYQATGRRAQGDGYRGGLVVNGLFVILLIIIFILAGRQIIFIFRLMRPIAPHQTPTLPPWLVGRPPTYREALRTSGAARGTGDVEDGFIAQNESLPKYGEYRGSTLLARSQSRGGDVPQENGAGGDVGMANMAERREGPAGVEGGLEGADVEGEDEASRATRQREEREHELRQIAEARRLQNGTGPDGREVAEDRAVRVEEAHGAAEPLSGKEKEQWEEVPLERRL